MLEGQGAAHLFDQAPEQHQQIFLRVANDLEGIASPLSVAKLEGVDRHTGTEKIGAKVKLVSLSGGIGQTHRVKPGVFKAHQAIRQRHFVVVATAT